MRYNEAGVYTLTYQGDDECGNSAIATREITVVPNDATVLYADGTLVINSLGENRQAEVAQYGAVVKEYPKLDGNNTYEFTVASEQPWAGERSQITNVKFGSETQPVEMAYWFQLCASLTSVDFTNCDASNVTSIRAMFANSGLVNVWLPDMPNLTTLQFAFALCADLVSVSFYNGSTYPQIENMVDTFRGCYAITEIDLSHLDGVVENCERAFANDTGGGNMSIEKIYVEDGKIDFSRAVQSTNMFRACVSIEGGNGTTFDPSKTNKQFARIDKIGQPGYFTERRA